jgi:hypothetical protein
MMLLLNPANAMPICKEKGKKKKLHSLRFGAIVKSSQNKAMCAAFSGEPDISPLQREAAGKREGLSRCSAN